MVSEKGSVILSTIVIFTSKVYVGIYQVDNVVKSLTVQILYVYAVVVPFKVLNMILGGGIIRSGGRTKYGLNHKTCGIWDCGHRFCGWRRIA